jgi:DNA (cytosine-5)-methyltransferase 1
MADGQLTAVDLFCGAGGAALGFHAAGFRIVAAADSDEAAGNTFSQNFTRLQPDCPPIVLAGDAGDLTRIDLGAIQLGSPPDVVIGGPPCQAFSRLGRAKLDSLSEEGFQGDPRNRLYERFVEAVRIWRPKAFVMENVPGMLSVGGDNYADLVAEELAEVGYRVGYALLNAVWYGIPQYRERVFFLGVRADLALRPAVPPRTHEATLPEGYRRPLREATASLFVCDRAGGFEGELAVPASPTLSPAVTVADAFDDLPAADASVAPVPRLEPCRLPGVPYRADTHSDYARLLRSWPGMPAGSGVSDHVCRRSTPRDQPLFARMQVGDRYPEAMVIARARFAAELARRAALGTAPAEGSGDWEELRDAIVPPYDETGFPDKWRKLYPDRPSWTVPAHLAKDSYSHIHPDGAQARMITIREAARLQSFPDGFLFCGNMGDCFRQIGNAVPPLLARAVAERLRAQLAG